MQNLDLLVVIDTMPMEITGWADVILPECTYLERYDTTSDMDLTVSRRLPSGCRQPNRCMIPNLAYWMARELSKKLGLE
ncbi:MAG: molybdopterin-dependent oxidoreductase [Marinilabiliales bacterium]|nr:molybdopterin-dependent oxidoreductase [Marinilabiliales bacterium]